MIFNSYLEHSEPISRNLEILNISKINNCLTSLFMFRYHHLNNLPETFTNYFVTNNQIHQHNTRNASQVHKSYKRTNCAKHTLSNKGVNVWNELDSKLKNIKSNHIFKRKVKKYILQTQENW